MRSHSSGGHAVSSGGGHQTGEQLCTIINPERLCVQKKVIILTHVASRLPALTLQLDNTLNNACPPIMVKILTHAGHCKLRGCTRGAGQVEWGDTAADGGPRAR